MKIQYCIFVLNIVFVAARVKIPADLQEYIDDLHAECVKKSGITEEDHKKYDISNKDSKMMCYMECLMMDSKWMAPDGSIQYDFITENAHDEIKDILVAAINKCRDIPNGSDKCEKSYNFHACMSKADPENWILV